MDTATRKTVEELHKELIEIMLQKAGVKKKDIYLKDVCNTCFHCAVSVYIYLP